jgi:lipopolysaccharide biosynthesis glycosyltransferase
MSLATIERIRGLVVESGNLPTFIDAEGKLPTQLPVEESDHVSSATFYRLYLASLLPDDVDTVIHLDLDVVATRSASELFSIDLKAPLAAVDHALPEEAKRLFGDRLGTYFQAGVLLIDLAHWRRQNVESRFHEILEKDRERIRWWDQDVLNIAFANEWQRLPIWFNACGSVRGMISPSELEDSAVLIHYDGHRKPWVRYSPHRYSEFWYTSFEQCFGYSLSEQLKREMARERLINRLLWPIRVAGIDRRVWRRLVQRFAHQTSGR